VETFGQLYGELRNDPNSAFYFKKWRRV